MQSEEPEVLRERLEIRRRQLDAVYTISAALASKTEVDPLLRETLRVALDTVDADAGSLLLYDSDRGKLVFAHVIGKTELLGQEIDPDQDRDGKAATVFRTGRPLLTADTSTEGYNSRFDSATGYRTQSILTVPLKNHGDSPIGVLQALNKRRGHFEIEDQDLLEIVGTLAATAIVNARLAEEAQLAAVARAVGDLGHDIKNALTPIETMIDTTVDLFILPMYRELDRLRLATGSEDAALRQAIDATDTLRAWYPEAHSAIKDGCEDIREMVSEIADYIKGTQATHMEPTRLDEALEGGLRRLRVLARTRRVTLHIEGLETVPEFAFDRRLVSRAVYNLVNNALGAINDAVKRGLIPMRPFNIRVRASVEPEENRTLSEAIAGRRMCRIEVEDDGPGMPEAIRKSLFTPNTISTTPGGTGIGTRFVKGVADAHHGRIGVESAPGAGAKFWMLLPIDR
jgi:signal transduction histidine kinase